jgi:3-oxoadipate enol-lactonase
MRRLEANGTTIVYARSGTGPPIVLMHGAEADHSMFAPLAAQLAKRLTVIAYDQRDSGDTRNPEQPYTLEDMGDDAAALIEGLGIEKAHVYGTSLGSLIAQSLAVHHPERVEEIRGAQTSILEGVGHVNAIQAPAQVAQVIFRFLGVT